MAMIVVDASVVIACVAGEPEREAILRAAGSHDLAAPASLPWEVGNALSAGFKRGRFSLANAEAALEPYRRMPIRRQAVDLGAAVRLAHGARLYAYDAYVLLCAKTLGCELLTLDRGLKAAARSEGVLVPEIKP